MMSLFESNSSRKTGIILNYFSLVLLAFSIMASEYRWAGGWPIAGIILGLALFILTFVPIYGRSGLWKFVHMSLEKLDERETKIIHHSMQVAYTGFTVLALLYIFILTMKIQFFAGLTDPSGDFSFGSVIFASFIYLSHILPASIIAWSERNVLLTSKGTE